MADPYWTNPDYQNWLNELMANAGDEWDDDEAMEAIVVRYVRHLESIAAKVQAAPGQLMAADPKLPVRVIVDRPVERTCLGRIHTHTAPNMTPGPDLDEIIDQLSTDGRWHLNDQDRRLIEDTLDAREALLAEQQTPPVEVPAVYLPDDGHWPAGGTVTILLHTPPTDTGERARWRPYSTARASNADHRRVVCLACQDGNHGDCYGGRCNCPYEGNVP